MREQEIADEEAAKKKKEWEKEWEVSSLGNNNNNNNFICTQLEIKRNTTSTLEMQSWTKDPEDLL